MKVKSVTPQRLTIESRPWILGTALIAAILLFAGVALIVLPENGWVALGLGLAAGLIGIMFVIFVRRVLVIFDRAAGAAVIRTATPLGQSERRLPLSEIRHAAVETTRSTSRSNGRQTTSTTHRPVLHTAAGVVPLTLISTSGNGADRVAEAINRWLSAPQA